jgi:hypothetical protein
MHVEFVQSDVGVGGEIYAHFDQSFTSFVIPAKGTANSGKFGNVVLTKGAILSLPLIPSGHLDVFSAATVTCVSDSLTRMSEIDTSTRGVSQDWQRRIHNSVVTHHAAQRTN